MFFPNGKAAFQFHDRITLLSQLHAGVGTEVALLRIAIDDIRLVTAQPLRVAPAFSGTLIAPGMWPLLKSSDSRTSTMTRLFSPLLIHLSNSTGPVVKASLASK